MESNRQNVSISSIIMHNDKFDDKAVEVNGYLKTLYSKEHDFEKTIQKRSIEETSIEVSCISTNQKLQFYAAILLKPSHIFWIDRK